MKKLNTILFLVGISANVAFGQATLIKGNLDFMKESKSIFVEFDMSKATIDALSSEEAYIAYKTKGKDAEKDVNKWLEGWNKDKKNFGDYFMEAMKRSNKKYPLAFNNDNPSSDYKMLVTVLHIETGNPIKYSSVKLKLTVTDASGKTVADMNIANATGAQMGPMTPTVGIRVNYALAVAASMYTKIVKKTVKK